MNNGYLIGRAARTGYHYRSVYGSFPVIIGIHRFRYESCGYLVLYFPDPPANRMKLFLPGLTNNDPVVGVHRTWLEPRSGDGVDVDEVYVPAPEFTGPLIWRSGEAMERMARP